LQRIAVDGAEMRMLDRKDVFKGMAERLTRQPHTAAITDTIRDSRLALANQRTSCNLRLVVVGIDFGILDTHIRVDVELRVIIAAVNAVDWAHVDGHNSHAAGRHGRLLVYSSHGQQLRVAYLASACTV